MLSYIRKNASGFFSKLILGGIALIFALYFGFSGGGAPSGGTAPIAKVNGDSIPSGLFNQSVQRRLDLYRQFKQDTSSAEMQKVVEFQVLQSLIANILLSQEAHRIGLYITDQELANAIRNNPGFHRNGSFDEDFYLNQWKPYYMRQNGQDFEFTLREELLQEKLRQVVESSGVVSRQAVENSLLLKDTQLKLVKLEIADDPTQKGANKSNASQLAKEWIQLKTEKKSTGKFIEENKLKESDVGPQSLQALISQFGGAESIPVLGCLLSLQPGEVCQQPWSVRKKIVAVALVERTYTDPGEEDITKMVEQLSRAKKTQLLNGVNNLLTRNAKIETYLNN